MIVVDSREVVLPDGKTYENELDEDGREWEYLNGAGLKNGHYCKHYCRKRDWRGESGENHKCIDGYPVEQHYCLKNKKFMGVSYCCGALADCFEEGKSAGVKRLLNKIRAERGYVIKE